MSATVQMTLVTEVRNMQNCLPVVVPQPRGFAAFDAVAIGASLGGPEALRTLLGGIPSDFPAAILVVQHLNRGRRPLPRYLELESPLPVKEAENGEPVRAGWVYIGPPDRHLVITAEQRILLSDGAPIKFCRPAAERLFLSAAAAYRERLLGVVLTGCNTDGAMGVQAIKWLGGRVLVQDPNTCRAPGMPRAAIATGQVDFILPIERIAAALVTMTMVSGAAEFFRVWPAAA